MADFFFTGAVTVLVTGEEAPLFPGRLHERGIVLTHLQYCRKNEIRFRLSIRDLGVLRKEARHFSGTIRFGERKGFPFLAKRFFAYFPFFLTSICFFVTLILLSAMIVRIDVQGADTDLQEDIQSFLKKEGVREGAVRFGSVDVQRISRQAVREIPGVTRFSLKKQGVVYFVDVSAERPKKNNAVVKKHITASKAGVIYDLFVDYGVADIRRGEFVEKGDRLITGTKKKPASAIVMAETWYKATVTAESGSLKTRAGEKRRNIFLVFHSKEHKLWTSAPFKRQAQSEENQYSFYFFSYRLPVSLRTETFYSLASVNTLETEAEQVKRAIQSAKASLMARLPEKASIIGENVLQKRVESGKVKMIIHFQVIENIAIN